MEKLFKVTLNSKKTIHPKGVVTHTFYIEAKTSKAANELALEDLLIFDDEPSTSFKAPKAEKLDADSVENIELLDKYNASKLPQPVDDKIDIDDHLFVSDLSIDDLSVDNIQMDIVDCIETKEAEETTPTQPAKQENAKREFSDGAYYHEIDKNHSIFITVYEYKPNNNGENMRYTADVTINVHGNALFSETQYNTPTALGSVNRAIGKAVDLLIAAKVNKDESFINVNIDSSIKRFVDADSILINLEPVNLDELEKEIVNEISDKKTTAKAIFEEVGQRIFNREKTVVVYPTPTIYQEKLYFDQLVSEFVPVKTEVLPEQQAKVVNNEPEAAETLPVDDLDSGADIFEEKELTEFEKAVNELNERLDSLKVGDWIIEEDLPNEVYHAANGDSSSKIKDSMISMMYYHNKHISHEIEQKKAQHFDVGNLCHAMVLQPHLVDLEYKQRPDIPTPNKSQLEKYDRWVKDGKKENQKLKPVDKIIIAYDAWVILGKPENNDLKPTESVLSSVTEWRCAGKPESFKAPKQAVIDSYDNCDETMTQKDSDLVTAWRALDEPKSYKRPTVKQVASVEAWESAGQPEPYKGKPTAKQIAACEAWEAAGRPEPYNDKPNPVIIEHVEFWQRFDATYGHLTIVNSNDWKLAENMAKAVKKDSFVSKLLNHPARKSEVSYFTICPITGRLIKCRTDLELGNIIADLKTIAMRGNPKEDKLLKKLKYEIDDRSYGVSAAMYLDITNKDEFYWIFVNKEVGYHWVAIIKASKQTLLDGQVVYTKKLQQLNDCEDANFYPKPSSIQNVVNLETGKLEFLEI